MAIKPFERTERGRRVRFRRGEAAGRAHRADGDSRGGGGAALLHPGGGGPLEEEDLVQDNAGPRGGGSEEGAAPAHAG
jgi:hypothetical protein